MHFFLINSLFLSFKKLYKLLLFTYVVDGEQIKAHKKKTNTKITHTEKCPQGKKGTRKKFHTEEGSRRIKLTRKKAYKYY